MAKKPPRKPTEDHAFIAFGKDGSVRKQTERYPSDKAGQEKRLAKEFCEGLSNITGSTWSHRLLSEADHDFEAFDPTTTVVCQAVEIVPKRDFLKRISEEQWIESSHPFTEVQFHDGSYWGVDQGKRDGILSSRIEGKFAKNYSKPKKPFWLLLWSVDPVFMVSWAEGGESRVSDGVKLARTKLAASGAQPFDEIWYKGPFVNPYRLWPC